MARQLADQYIEAGCTYDFWLTPSEVPDLASATRRGINCVIRAHLFVKDYFDVHLPAELRCTELYLDDSHLAHDSYEPGSVDPGDLVWFGRANSSSRDTFRPDYAPDGNLRNWRQAPVSHVGIALPSSDGTIDVLHAIPGENVTIWPIERFAEVPRYEQFRGISKVAIAAVA